MALLGNEEAAIIKLLHFYLRNAYRYITVRQVKTCKSVAWPVKGDTEDSSRLYYDNQPIAHLLI